MTINKDADLQHDVLDELEWEPSVNASEIGVTAQDGIVTLTGQVNSYSEKLGAVKAARRIEGVKAIANDIHVRIPGDSTRTDTDIARAALNSLNWNNSVPKDSLTVTVNNGLVRLEGEVRWQYQKSAAEYAVRHLRGVIGVSNAITIKPQAKSQDIHTRIESALHRRAELDAKQIRVEARDGKITLRGKVHSLSEREAAEDAAWAAPGVATIDNLIAVDA